MGSGSRFIDLSRNLAANQPRFAGLRSRQPALRSLAFRDNNDIARMRVWQGPQFPTWWRLTIINHGAAIHKLDEMPQGHPRTLIGGAVFD